ncbi:structural maintenance of chromosome 1 [Enteropsectra breve]|nr:structural maintenance of chromosome 1 [Enteropsectra breve]
MSLVKIELKNFKSYKGSYTIGPFHRFTSIIGPNGSGKSNILDAVMFAFVLPGTSHRIKKNEDVIARGCSDASVKVYVNEHVFEREIKLKEAEKTVSVFKFDGNRLSQKEYISKLEGLNIYGHIKNFVICQGDILNSNVDLLKMVETVSGSLEHVEEYKGLEERLVVLNKEVSAKFERRKDYMEYLRDAKESEEKQLKFKKLVEEKERIENKINSLEIEDKSREIEALSTEISKLKESKERIAKDEVSKNMNEIKREAAKVQKNFFEKESEFMYLKSRSEVNNSEELLAEKKEKLKEKQGNKESFDKQLVLLNRELSGYNLSDVASMRQMVEEKETEFSRETDGENRMLNKLTLANIEKINKRDELKTQCNSSKRKLSSLMSQKKVFEQRRKESDEKIKNIQKSIVEYRRKIESKEETYDRIVADEESKSKELNEIIGDILLNKARKNDTVKKSIVNSVIYSLKNIYTGVHGKVLDLISPIQKRYETAVGILLGNYATAVVVENESVALECIKYLKETKSCKLQFLPLNKLRGAAKSSTLNGSDDEWLAQQCIKFDSKYSGVVDLIFGDSLIISNESIAKKRLYEEKCEKKICTLSGMLYTPYGIIVGGNEHKNKFEENMIERLLEKRKTVLNELKVIKDRKAAFEDVKIIKEAIEAAERSLREIEDSLNEGSIPEEIGYLSGSVEKLESELSAYERELSEYEEEKKEILAQIKAKERVIMLPLLSRLKIASIYEFDKITENISKMKELNSKNKLYEEEIAEISGEMEKLREAVLHSQKNNLSGMESELSELGRKMDEIKIKLREGNAMYKKGADERERLETKILSGELHLAKLVEELKEIEAFREMRETAEITLASEESIESLALRLGEINREINANIPSFGAVDSSIQSKYMEINREYENAKASANAVKKRFYEVRTMRMEAFSLCFNRLAREVTEIYKVLSRTADNVEGNAYVVYEGNPFTNNLKFYLMPPNKRFTEFSSLSGGEKSLALLSFIIALNKCRQAPFYIFDEIDSALDKENIWKLAAYLEAENEQFIVVSHKIQMYSRSDALVGVYKCPSTLASKILTLKL